MFFDVNIFGIHKNGSFSKCWLAATNPTLFKSFVMRGEMDEIGISTLCDEMRAELTAGLVNSSHRMPLYFAAQLVYGAVRIYQQQVDTLYEKTNHLLYFHNANMRELMLKRPRNSDETFYLKKQRLSVDLAEDAKQYEIDLSAPQAEDICELLCHDSQAGKPQDFLIREEEKDEFVITDDDDEGFGIINEAEMQNLLDTLRAEDGSTEDTQSFLMKEMNIERNNSESTRKKDSQAVNLDNELHQEVDMIREAIREDEPTPMTLSFEDVLNSNISIQINEGTIENMRSFGLQPQLVENVDIGGEQPTAVVVPDQPISELDELQLNEIIRSKRKRKNAKLKIDKCIKISYNDFLKQFDYSKTLRCFTPRNDIVPPYIMNFKESSRLFKMPSSNLASNNLLNAFKRNLKTKAIDINANILDDILGMESVDFEEINPEIRRNTRQGTRYLRSDLNRRSETEPIAALLPPFEVTNTLEITANDLKTANLQDIIQKNLLCSESGNSVEDPLYLRLKDDLLTDFEGTKDREDDTNFLISEINPCNSIQLNRSQWGKEVVIRRLLHLWKNKVGAITMKLLCHNVQRKDAAYTFLCLLELRARHYVELKRDIETNEITDIEMGLKILKRFSETFK